MLLGFTHLLEIASTTVTARHVNINFISWMSWHALSRSGLRGANTA
jgi:hypothetical protein